MSEAMNDIRREAECVLLEEESPPKTLIQRTFYTPPENFSLEYHAELKQTAQTALELCLRHEEGFKAMVKSEVNGAPRVVTSGTMHAMRTANSYNNTAIKEFTTELERLADNDGAVEAWVALTPEQQTEQMQLIAELRGLIEYRNNLIYSFKLLRELVEDKIGDHDSNASEVHLMEGMIQLRNEKIKQLHAKVIRPCWLRAFVQKGRPVWLQTDFDPAEFDKMEGVH